MRSLLVPSGQAPGEAAAQFAKELHTRWGVGDKACNNGVLFLLSVDDRQVYINTGTGGGRWSKQGCVCCCPRAVGQGRDAAPGKRMPDARGATPACVSLLPPVLQAPPAPWATTASKTLSPTSGRS